MITYKSMLGPHINQHLGMISYKHNKQANELSILSWNVGNFTWASIFFNIL